MDNSMDNSRNRNAGEAPADTDSRNGNAEVVPADAVTNQDETQITEMEAARDTAEAAGVPAETQNGMTETAEALTETQTTEAPEGSAETAGDLQDVPDGTQAGAPEGPRETAGESQGEKSGGNRILKLLNTEGMRYLIIGGCTTLVNLVVFTILCRAVHLNVNVANFISIVVAIIFAYITNKLIVFRSHCSSFGELVGECARFIGARIATMIIEVGGVFLLYNVLHQNEMIAKLATQVLVIIGNYFISRFIVFRDRN